MAKCAYHNRDTTEGRCPQCYIDVPRDCESIVIPDEVEQELLGIGAEPEVFYQKECK